MKTMTVRDVRHHWLEAEKAVELEGGVIVTRDSKPVAQIIAFHAAAPKPRKLISKEEHLALLRESEDGEIPEPWVDDWIAESREHSLLT